MYEQAIRRAEAEVHEASVNFRRCTTIPGVMAMFNDIMGVRGLPIAHLVPGLKNIPAVAERRLREVAMQQILDVEQIPDPARRADAFHLLQRKEWAPMVVRFPGLYRNLCHLCDESRPATIAA